MTHKARYNTNFSQFAMNDYIVVSSGNGNPTILQNKKFSSISPTYQETKKVAEIRRNYSYFPKKREINPSDWSFFNSFFEKWENGLTQLRNCHFSSNVNPDFELASERAFFTTISWMAKIFLYNPHLESPDVVANGDGGIDIEWEKGDKLISIHIRKTQDEGDRVYFQNGDAFSSVELSGNNLRQILSEI